MHRMDFSRHAYRAASSSSLAASSVSHIPNRAATRPAHEGRMRMGKSRKAKCVATLLKRAYSVTLIREVDARRALKSGLLANPAPRQTFPLADSKQRARIPGLAGLSLGLVGSRALQPRKAMPARLPKANRPADVSEVMCDGRMGRTIALASKALGSVPATAT